MTSLLSELAARAGKNAAIFREGKNEPFFYCAGADIPVTGTDFLKKTRDGAFCNLYPTDEWYENALRALIKMPDERPCFASTVSETEKIFVAYRFASGASGDGFFINDEGKRMLISAVFAEADVLRANMRNDKGVLLRRGEKTAELYYGYYYSGDTDKGSRGALSRAAAAALKNILLLSGNDLTENGLYIK